LDLLPCRRSLRQPVFPRTISDSKTVAGLLQVCARICCWWMVTRRKTSRQLGRSSASGEEAFDVATSLWARDYDRKQSTVGRLYESWLSETGRNDVIKWVKRRAIDLSATPGRRSRAFRIGGRARLADGRRPCLHHD